MDDKHVAVPKARTHCRHAGTGLELSGTTDVFGEVKFPGLERGTFGTFRSRVRQLRTLRIS